MSLLIDATPLLLRSAGVKGYLWHWIQALQSEAGPDVVRTFPSIMFNDSLNHERSMMHSLSTLASLGVLHATNFGIPLLSLKTGGAALFHATNQVKRPPRTQYLTSTIHDMTCWSMPELHERSNVKADMLFAENVWMNADALIAVSENTRRDAIEYLKLDPAKVVTIHSGVAESYFNATDGQACAVASRLGLEKPFALCVGTIEPRKNTDRLLDAWTALPQRVHRDFDLVFAGPEGWAAPATLARLKSPPASIRWLGYVAEKDLPGLTRAAEFSVYTSLYEGFGFPLAQAMAAETASLTSCVSSLPEVGRDGCAYADPSSVESIRDGLLRLIDSESERKRLGARAREIAEESYRWPVCARRSLELFRQIGALR